MEEKIQAGFKTMPPEDWAGTVYLIFLFLFIPLYWENYYFNILEAKFHCYAIATLVFFVLFCAAKTYRFFKRKPRPPFSLHGIDLYMLAFLSLSALSAVFSPYPQAAFTGENGRYQGFITLLLYGLGYLIITRSNPRFQAGITAGLAGAGAVCLLALLNHFGADPLGFFTRILASEREAYLSTIGHINTFSSYVSLFLPVALVLFCLEKKNSRSIFYALIALLCFCGLLIGNSDSGYLGFLVVVSLFPLFIMEKHVFRRFLGLIAVFFIAARLLGAAAKAGSGFNALVSVSALFAYHPVFLFVIACLLLLLFGVKKEKTNFSDWKRRWKIVLACLFLCAAVLLLLANSPWSYSLPAPIQKLLAFNDQWGSTRGYVWSRLISQYLKAPFLYQLIGYGPDTVGPLMESLHQAEMGQNFLYFFDNAHNEYLQYLLTLGALGLAAYVCLLVYVIREAFRPPNHPLKTALAFSLISFSAQAFVNINQIITTPLFMTIVFCTYSYANFVNNISKSGITIDNTS